MNTPKNFALQLGALITLYVSLTSLMTLLFGVITVMFPDAADSYWATESATGTIRFSIAILIVFFPVYLWLTRTLNQIRRTEDATYLTLTKWLIYLSLLVGGAVLLGDLVAVIYNFLEGEITTRFLLKAGVLALTIAAAFYYYLKDAQNHWQTHEKNSIYFGAVATLVVVAALVLGFYNSETPAEVREAKIDDKQIQDLQEIQHRIEDSYRIQKELPAGIENLYSGIRPPQAPEGRTPYTYNVTGETSYELCATFAQDSAASEYSYARPVMEKNYNWSHGAGEWCFERVIDDRLRQ